MPCRRYRNLGAVAQAKRSRRQSLRIVHVDQVASVHLVEKVGQHLLELKKPLIDMEGIGGVFEIDIKSPAFDLNVHDLSWVDATLSLKTIKDDWLGAP